MMKKNILAALVILTLSFSGATLADSKRPNSLEMTTSTVVHEKQTAYVAKQKAKKKHKKARHARRRAHKKNTPPTAAKAPAVEPAATAPAAPAAH